MSQKWKSCLHPIPKLFVLPTINAVSNGDNVSHIEEEVYFFLYPAFVLWRA
jgi:hypothetical protein